MNGTDKVSTLPTTPVSANRLPIILSCLLVAQIGLALLLRANAVQYQSTAQNAATIIPCDSNTLNKLIIEDNPADVGKKKSSLVLESHGTGWELPDQYGFPAANRSVKDLIDQLCTLKKDFPVATTSDSFERFKVRADNCQHSITLFAKGKQLGTLFVGAPSGPKSVDVRWSGNNDVYSASLPVNMLSTRPSDWYNTVLIQFGRADVDAVDFADFGVHSSGKGWILSYAGKEQPISSVSKESVINKLIGITFQSVLGRKDLPEYHSDKPGLVYKIKVKQKKDPIIYSFSQFNDGPNWVLKKSDVTFYLLVDNWFVNNVKLITPAQILQIDASPATRKQEELEQAEAKALQKRQLKH